MIGTILNNRYELLEKIGEGGMAEVYKARCHKLNRYDAVKILKRDYSDDTAVVEKFKREATAIANLSDNNIINIFDVGTQGDIHYIVMEYVKGKTLKEIIVENVRLSYERAIDIAIQICRALDCAHRNNIVHRDIKPQNILLTEEGVVKVTDFGIAKASSSVTITNSNKVIGSAHYFSPEQARGNFVDARTDIYSLGIVLYEMVTGTVPFNGDSPVTIALKHIQENPIEPKQINRSVPESLNRLILKAIEKDPSKRYQTIKEMMMDLVRMQKDLNYQVVPSNVEDDHTKIMEPVNVNEKEENVDDIDKVSGKAKKIILFVLACILVIIMGATAAYLITNNKANTVKTAESKEVEVPDIVGMSKEDAEKKLEEVGLKYAEQDEDYDQRPAGTVIASFPEAGTKKLTGQEVRVRISLGPSSELVPTVVNNNIDTAKDIIENSGFKAVEKGREFSDTIPKNAVISQDPEGDSEAPKGSDINLIISDGPRLVSVPDLVGKKIDEAEDELTNLKLKIDKKEAVPTKDAEQVGVIIDQYIKKDTQVAEGASISVKYYVEITKYNVPNFINQTVKDAKGNQLVSEGKIKLELPEGAKDEDVIINQDPRDGNIFEGDSIKITIQAPSVSAPENQEPQNVE